MSHEIRTPLSGVIGMVHLALKADPNERQRECLEQIQFAGQHLLGIVNDILDFSKIEAGKLQLEETDFVLAELLAALAGQTTPAALDKGLSLVFQCDDGLAERYRGDALRIHQVLLNFVGNAVKFSCRGEVRVRVMAPDGAAPGSGLRFEVSDQGPGLTAADAAGLFQSFHQADASTTRRHGGTGLGLAICRQLATLMGGEVGVHSQPGVGSTFWFSVPV
ncbi:hybrid sensor histidine kinase/response regulator, partial [Rubrivivax gelatinosus]|nr:hybrid sensor histidine kinase/response regulator [Rubrivivax gelatinosus]